MDVDYETVPEADIAYKFGMEQKNVGKVLYFTGSKSGNFLATSEDIKDAVDVYIEYAEGDDFYIYFMDGESKKYVEMYEYTAGKVGVQITDTPTNANTVDSARKAVVTTIGGSDYYMGTYKEFETISASSFSYIEDASVVGVTQFPACFITVEEETEEPSEPSEPTEEPTEPTTEPTEAPTEPTTEPTEAPTEPAGDPTPDTTLSIADAIALGSSKAHDNYTEGKYYVTGEIVEVYNETYGNMRIKDTAGNVLTVYGTYNADGSARYDAMETKPVAGDTVTVYGIIGQYSNAAQMKNGWITQHIPGEGAGETDGIEAELDSAAASITFNDTAKRTVFTNEQQVWEENGITVINDKAASTSDIADYKNPVRFYQGSNVTVECGGMTKIVFKCNNSSYAQELKNTLGDAATLEGSYVIVELGSGANSFVVEKLVKQVRLNAIYIFA